MKDHLLRVFYCMRIWSISLCTCISTSHKNCCPYSNQKFSVTFVLFMNNLMVIVSKSQIFTYRSLTLYTGCHEDSLVWFCVRAAFLQRHYFQLFNALKSLPRSLRNHNRAHVNPSPKACRTRLQQLHLQLEVASPNTIRRARHNISNRANNGLRWRLRTQQGRTRHVLISNCKSTLSFLLSLDANFATILSEPGFARQPKYRQC